MPIIALTANAMKGDDKNCIDAGCDDYLPKPLDRRQLFEKIRKYLPQEEEALDEKIDFAKSEVDEIAELCFDRTSRSSQSGEPSRKRHKSGELD